jgi:hypothetical protein
MRIGRMGPAAGVVGGLILIGIGLWMTVTTSGTDLATFGWLLVLVGAASVVGNIFVGMRMR